MTLLEGSPYDAALALGIEGPLHEFNAAGVLSTSDVHVALRLAGLGAVDDDVVTLGAAFAARAPRLGHVCVDLASIRATASSDTDLPADLDALPWPDPAGWIERMAASPLVGDGRPLHLDGTNLYLDRLWADERAVAADLRLRAATPAPGVDGPTLATGLHALFGGDDDPDLQRMAAAAAVLRRVAVVAGGPGTGKTRTVARVLALLDAQAGAAGTRAPLVALAAPTGKAAARLEEAVRDGADDMAVGEAVKDRLRALAGVTLHRLLGFNPGNRTRFRHNRLNRLPFDVVVVDETSMVSLSLMARLLEAVRPEARLILVGDPEQLASVEAGAVLGDIVGPASKGLCMDEAARAELAAVTGQRVPPGEGAAAAIGDGIVVLHRVHRYGGAIAALAEAIQQGDADGALRVLQDGGSNVEWIVTDEQSPAVPSALPAVRAAAVESGRTVIEAARAGDASSAIAALGHFRLLCAHRQGPDGVATWMQHVEDWLRAEVEGFLTGGEWYVGRPLIVTENDYGLRLYNGDTGVVVEAGDGRLVAAFERAGGVAEVSPTRLAAVDTVYAMTVHKSQGSQFHTVALLLPGSGSRLLTRELLYTAVTRAQERLILVGAEEPIRAAVARPISRASGLRAALWGGEGP
ncbi:MAG TPA: exodeoxyribonuclease V subunit alpha [Acidimicrobiales bacterium]|nr:exodeoxyribonuclease V subunit alpha [Acidimicrobiales bacterium]